MRLILRIFCFCLITSMSVNYSNAQARGDSVKIVLDQLAISDIPQLNDTIDLSLSNISISELVRSVSNHIGININVEPIETVVHNNYSQIRTKDLLYLLCKEYDLELKIYGSIISLNRIKREKFTLKVSYKDAKLSFEIKDAPMSNFTKELAQATGVNVFVPPEFKGYAIDGFAKDVNIEDALYSLGKVNNFIFIKEADKLYVVEKMLASGESESSRRRKAKSIIDEKDGYYIKKKNVLLKDIIQEVAETTRNDVTFTEKMTEKSDVSLHFRSIDQFLNSLLTGTKYTYKKQDSIYFIGLKSKKEMHSYFLYKFKHRQVDSLMHVLPDGVKESVEMAEYPEINSLLINGDMARLLHMKRICMQLDQMIPVVLIDVIMVESSNTLDLSTGVSAGTTKSGETPVETGGTLLPGTDFTLNGASINSVLKRVGLSNLGTVKSNFYVQLQALEQTGFLEVQSTPKLSTISGRKASLSIGETVYYEEKLVSIYGSQTTTNQEQIIYKPIEARLGVDIRPVVTGNGFINLTVDVIQSSFTERIGADGKGPPGIVARQFKSTIRVKDGETILLGGLENVRKEKYRSGTPFLSRIPLIGLLFSSKSKKNSDDKFSIFISPKIVY